MGVFLRTNINEMNIYKTTVKDTDTLIKLRFDFFKMEQMSLSIEDKLLISSQLKSYFAKCFVENSFVGVIIEEDGEIASAGFLIITEKPASPKFLTGYTGNIMNVLTYPKFRRKGYATKIIQRIIKEGEQMNVTTFDLSATKEGLKLYSKLGFKELNYTPMRLNL